MEKFFRRETPDQSERCSQEYSYLSDLFSKRVISNKENREILDGLDKIRNPKEKEVFRMIFTEHASQQVLVKTGYKDNELEGALDGLAVNKGVQKLLPHLWDEGLKNNIFDDKSSEQYRFALAMLTSQLKKENIPQELMDRIIGAREANISVISGIRNWNPLCSDAEVYMSNLMKENQGQVLVGGAILNKTRQGYTAGICLEPVIAETGLLIPGMWYTCYDPTVRCEIENIGGERGNGVIDFKKGSWVLMRPMIESYAHSRETYISIASMNPEPKISDMDYLASMKKVASGLNSFTYSFS